MKKLILGCGVATLAVGLMMLSGAEADHNVTVQIRPLHSKTCVTAVEAALKGKASKFEVSKEKATITVTVPHTGPVNCLDLIGALRGKGYEPLSLVMSVGLDTKIIMKSGGFGVKESQQELKDALSELGFLEINSADIRGAVLTVPVSSNAIDIIKLLNAAGKAGFALSGVEVQGSPATTTVVASNSGGALKQMSREICITSKSLPARVFTRYKGIDVPFCCKNCQATFEGLDEKEKDFAVRDAVDRLGEERKKKGPAAAPVAGAAKLPTQASLGNTCVILKGEAAKPALTRQYKGLNVPLCCKNCQGEWDKMSDDEKLQTLAAAAKK